MLVDNPIMQQPIFGDSSSSSSSMNDISDFFHTELFPSSSSTLPSSGATLSPGAPGSNSSRASSPSSPSSSMSQILSTPPQQPLQNSFPEVQDPYSFLGGSAASAASSNFGFGFGGGFGGVGGSSSSFFNFLDEDFKVDPSSTISGLSALDAAGGGAPFDFLNAFSSGGDVDMSASLDALLKSTNASSSSTSSSPASSSASGSASTQSMAIDPQLVDTPSHVASDDEEEQEEEMEEPAKKARSTSNKTTGKKTSKEEEKLTLTIAPVKVGGHGKARKGTVQGGGVTKKVASSSLSAVSSSTSTPLPAAPTPTSLHTATTAPSSLLSASASSSSRNKENVSSLSSKKSEKDMSEKDEDDDLPADWRPPPEVFQKMTSKEKRQLRNKISARNFRVRRKEYINTLEMDIAERDRLLQAIRSELGSTQSENLALRQEIAALKRALLEGRGHSPSSSSIPLSPTSMRASSPNSSIRGSGADVNLNSTAVVSIDDLNLPPPAPLPERSAADELAARATATAAAVASSPNLLTPNTQKDLPTSPRVNGGFWGGVSQSGFGGLGGMGGGITPVHTVLMPDLNMRTEANISIGQWVRDVVAANAAAAAAREPSVQGKAELQENMNPMLQVKGAGEEDVSAAQSQNGFDGFADSNLFTMKTLDAYRMQLWSKMASQQSHHNHNHNHNHNHHVQHHAHSNTHHPHHTHHTTSHARKNLERELSPSPFTLPSHQPGPNHPHLSGLASSLKPAFFVNSNKPNLPSSSTPSQFSRPPVMGSTLSALLAGKHSIGSSPPGSPNLSGKVPVSIGNGNGGKDKKSPTPAQVQQAQNAMYAAALATTASQTLLGKLGSAFWDAFSGSSHGTGASGSSGAAVGVGAGGAKSWDADKVRKVLEGKAVVRVVDVEEPVASGSKVGTVSPRLMPKVVGAAGQGKEEEKCNVTSMLEEGMRSLSLGKK